MRITQMGMILADFIRVYHKKTVLSALYNQIANDLLGFGQQHKQKRIYFSGLKPCVHLPFFSKP